LTIVNQEPGVRFEPVEGKILERQVFHLPAGRYLLHVSYGDDFDLARQLGYLLDLDRNPLEIDISEGELTREVVSLTDVLGMVEGLITIDNQAPGDNNGLVVCARLPLDLESGPGDSRRTRTCVDLEADGSFQVVLPTPPFGSSPARIAVCLIDQIDLCLPLEPSRERRAPEPLDLLNFDAEFFPGEFNDVGVHDIQN